MLNTQDIKTVTQAIRDAEGQTSGEIRVYIAKKCKGEPYSEALSLFHKLKMHKTQRRNGVLIFVSPSDRKAAVVGDEGIHSIAETGYWDSVLKVMLAEFAATSIAEGLCKGIAMIGTLIKDRFPLEEGDINELSDEIVLEK
jgi:uncharacterized membrane protein